MRNTLGLDDDLDSVELVQDLELIFDVEVFDQEAKQIVTVGDFYDLLLMKLPPNDADRKRASAMTFYRIRTALRQLGYGDKHTPTTDARILERGRTKSNLKKLEAEARLRLPKAVSTRIGRLAALSAFVMTFSAVFLLQRDPTITFIGFIAGLIVAGAIIEYGDPGQLPPNCKTLAELTKKAARMNYGRLIRMGARHRDDDIWEALVEALSGYALPETEITRETVFLQSQLKKLSAA